MTNERSIFEFLGGRPRLETLVTRFYSRVVDDPLLHELFSEMSPDHLHGVVVWLTEVFGGPADYSKLRGGHAALIKAHRGWEISDQQRRRWVELMLETAHETLPDDPRLHETLAGYFNWGSRIAVAASQPGFVDDRPAEPVPRWSWHGLEAPRPGSSLS